MLGMPHLMARYVAFGMGLRYHMSFKATLAWSGSPMYARGVISSIGRRRVSSCACRGGQTQMAGRQACTCMTLQRSQASLRRDRAAMAP